MLITKAEFVTHRAGSAEEMPAYRRLLKLAEQPPLEIQRVGDGEWRLRRLDSDHLPASAD